MAEQGIQLVANSCSLHGEGVTGWGINENGQGLHRTEQMLVDGESESPVLWPPDPLVPVFSGDQPSESSQQGPRGVSRAVCWPSGLFLQ